MSDYDDYDEERSIGFLLGLGIFLMPIIFAWFTLRSGYSKKAKIIAFLWLFLTSIIPFTANNQESSQNTKTTVQTPPAPPPAPTPKSDDDNTMSFEACSELQDGMIASVVGTGYEYGVVMDTNDLRMVRICTNDGSVLITCNRPDRKRIITQSPDCPL